MWKEVHPNGGKHSPNVISEERKLCSFMGASLRFARRGVGSPAKRANSAAAAHAVIPVANSTSSRRFGRIVPPLYLRPKSKSDEQDAGEGFIDLEDRSSTFVRKMCHILYGVTLLESETLYMGKGTVSQV
jgi:hypothetical protein